MKRVIGFASFFIAVGMIAALLIPSIVWCILILIGMLLVSYKLFCCK